MSCTCLRSARPMVASTSRLGAPAAGSVRAIHAPASLPAKGRVPEMRGTCKISLTGSGLVTRGAGAGDEVVPEGREWAVGGQVEKAHGRP